MTEILVTGSDGQLGSELQALAKHCNWARFNFTTINELDITDQQAVSACLEEREYSFLINCSAYTAVDKAETDQEAARKVNATAVATLAKSCNTHGIKTIHISTDYVFDGKNHLPYKEEDAVSPQSVYGHTKLEGETELTALHPQSVVIRTSWLYSTYGHNFVKTILKYGSERDELKVVFDQIGTPTYAADLAECILSIINQSVSKNHFVSGIYHYSNEGVASWYDFAYEIVLLSGLGCKVQPVESHEFPTVAVRPAFSVMNKGKIKRVYGIDIPHWKTSLSRCLSKLLES